MIAVIPEEPSSAAAAPLELLHLRLDACRRLRDLGLRAPDAVAAGDLEALALVLDGRDLLIAEIERLDEALRSGPGIAEAEQPTARRLLTEMRDLFRECLEQDRRAATSLVPMRDEAASELDGARATRRGARAYAMGERGPSPTARRLDRIS